MTLGFTEVHEKLDLGNPMQGDEEEVLDLRAEVDGQSKLALQEETDLSSSASTSVEEDGLCRAI